MRSGGWSIKVWRLQIWRSLPDERSNRASSKRCSRKNKSRYRVVGGVRFYERPGVQRPPCMAANRDEPLDPVSATRASTCAPAGESETPRSATDHVTQREGIGLGEAFARAEEVPGILKKVIGGMLEMARLLGRILEAAERRLTPARHHPDDVGDHGLYG